MSGRLVRSPAVCLRRLDVYTPILRYLISVSMTILHLHIKRELYIFFALQDAESVEQIALVDVHIGQKQRDTFERYAYFACH